MKKIGFITTSKVLAQSLAAAVSSNPALGLAPFLLLDAQQAPLDAEVLQIDVGVVDVIGGTAGESKTALALCRRLRLVVPGCRLLLLVSQEGASGRQMAISAMKNKLADDFVFYDTSLGYLFAKLAAF